MYWNPSKIEAIAPNKASLRRAKLLAKSSQWAQLSTDYRVIWGLSTVLEHEHYEVRISLLTNHHQCSCLSNTICKHILGLLLLYQKSSALFKYRSCPDSIDSWLKNQQLGPANTPAKTIKKSKSTSKSTASAQRAKEKRWQNRLELMDAGIQALELWLTDMIRQGLANVPIEDAAYWSYIAAKMMDAKLPAISVYLKETQSMVQQSSDWSGAMLERIGHLFFWIQSFKNRGQLSESEQELLYISLGKTIQKKTVLAQNISLIDHWLVVGIKIGNTIDKQLYRRVWLQGSSSHKMALIEDFSYFNNPFEQQYQLGSIIHSRLYFYNQTAAWRGLLEQADSIDKTALQNWSSFACFETALAAFHKAIVQNPWLRFYPFIIRDIAFYLDAKNKLQCLDIQNQSLPIQTVSEQNIWQLLASSGGQAVPLMAEWDGQQLKPISILLDTKFIPLS